MGKKQEDRDLAVKIAISGNDEDIGNTGITITDDYFRRERRENLHMSAVCTWRPPRPRFDKTEYEKAYWYHAIGLQLLNDSRPNGYEIEKEGHLEENFDEDKFHPWIIKETVKL